MDEDEYLDWSLKYKAAMQSLTNREELIEDCVSEIEFDFEIIGSTAIEDKL